MVRGNGSARAETGAKATARPNTIRITMGRGLLRDTLGDPSTMTISLFRSARDAQRTGTHGVNLFRFAIHMIPHVNQTSSDCRQIEYWRSGFQRLFQTVS